MTAPIRPLLVDLLRSLRALHEADPRRLGSCTDDGCDGTDCDASGDGLARFITDEHVRNVFPEDEDPDLSDAAIERLADEWIADHAADCGATVEAIAADAPREREIKAERLARAN